MLDRTHAFTPPLDIAVVGSGISGLSAAWLLADRHRVTLYEAERRLGGHSNTVMAPTSGASLPVDTGFIVYNEATYPNLTAMFAFLGVPTEASDMSFAVSLDGGRLEYAGTDLSGLFVQKRNLANPRFYRMLADLLRFYRSAPRDIARLPGISLEDYLRRNGYSAAFRDDHLYPMAAAIWSTPAAEVGAYPAASFIRFCENHGLLKIADRPVWRTVTGGSRTYVQKLAERLVGGILTGRKVTAVTRSDDGVLVTDGTGTSRRFDRVLLACHGDQALRLLATPTERENQVLGAFRYSRNLAILHRDPALMPRRRKAWCSWNYLADRRDGTSLTVTYWMNRLQGLDPATPLFVTLNPAVEPDPALVIHRETYEHPMFDQAAMAAQERLWTLQGDGNVWYAGAFFGAGFHEDGLQAGLAAAEMMGGVRRPWRVADESGRISLPVVSSEEFAA